MSVPGASFALAKVMGEPAENNVDSCRSVKHSAAAAVVVLILIQFSPLRLLCVSYIVARFPVAAESSLNLYAAFSMSGFSA